MEDEPPVDTPQVMIDEPHLPVDELRVLCIPYTPSFKKSLEEIQLFEHDGESIGKNGKKSMKRRHILVESKCATSHSLCSRRMLKKDGWLEMWTVLFGRYKLLHDLG